MAETYATPMSVADDVERFLGGEGFAVAGASNDRRKFGNKVLRCYWQDGRAAYPVNPTCEQIEGAPSFATVDSIVEPVHGLSVITPPSISASVVRDAVRAGIRHVWFQPGAESDEALALAREANMTVIAGGPCLLVVLGFDGGAR